VFAPLPNPLQTRLANLPASTGSSVSSISPVFPGEGQQEARGKTQEYNRDHEQAADDSELIVVHSADGNGAAIIFKPA
jgi:hypothetical protein